MKGALIILIFLSACQPEADLDVHLVDDCDPEEAASAFSLIKSFRVSLLHDTGWYNQTERTKFLGCIKHRKCFTDGEHFTSPLTDLEEIRQIAVEAGVIFHTTPGSNQAIVLTGFVDEDCTPQQAEPQIPICGYHVGPVPDDDAEFPLLVTCNRKLEICWNTEHKDVCEQD